MAQHYLVCGTKHCRKNCQFYCNPCDRQMCEQCKDKHQKSPKTNNHEVVPYTERRRKLPLEKCKDHPKHNIGMFCKYCQIPVCSKCATKKHQKNALHNLEMIYSDRFYFCLSEIYKINHYFLPTSKDMQGAVHDDAEEIKSVIMKIRAGADTMTLDELEQVNKIEETLLDKVKNQDKIYKDYISDLEDLVTELNGYLSSSEIKNNPILNTFSWHFNVQPIPETTKLVPPKMTDCQNSKEDAIKILGRATLPDINLEKRKIKSMDTAIKYREYTVPCVDDACHISVDESKKIWVSDNKGNLVHTDLQGNQLQKIETSGRFEGFHTVTQKGDLLCIDDLIKREKWDSKINEFNYYEEWEPLSIHSSHINGDILVGLMKGREAKVTRYNRSGEEIQNIQRDKEEQYLYSFPHYITENINGDICTSEYLKQGVEVVDRSGQHKFFYTGKGSVLHPFGICTNLLRHIMVCDVFRNTIHVLDEHGQCWTI